MKTLAQYTEHLEFQIKCINGDLGDIHVEEWKRPRGQNLLRELEVFESALELAKRYQASEEVSFQ